MKQRLVYYAVHDCWCDWWCAIRSGSLRRAYTDFAVLAHVRDHCLAGRPSTPWPSGVPRAREAIKGLALTSRASILSFFCFAPIQPISYLPLHPVVGMVAGTFYLLQLAAVFGVVSAIPSATNREVSEPTVQLDRATVIGSTNGSVTSYMGIPFAEPPYVPSPCSAPSSTD